MTPVETVRGWSVQLVVIGDEIPEKGGGVVVEGAELAVLGVELTEEGGVGVGLEIEEAVKEVVAEENAESNAKEVEKRVAEVISGGKRKKKQKK
ncbi:hypothetical protein DAPPUDRAFT_325582 [Daphnia pulex]|uniref:Uncharacterized protein n=1 Tax=Daphnia pulex TaxID=6669 RepID=E9H566_DAPPU|nr:hypothetical protein DAPPUDRAFT_325582 [Daphnia pulex]|eukprot:EFX73076.1 hypothetical protein DAPPUDRAFT_325582 [Daphnia pulex]